MTEQSDFWARHGNPHPEPGLPSERAVTERLADAVARGDLAGTTGPQWGETIHCGGCGDPFRCGDDLHDCPALVPAETITAEAERLVLGDRQDDYGHPADDFAKTGRMWGAVLEDWVRAGGGDVPPELVALMMVCVKISREVNRPKRDNRVDGIGYFLTAQLIHERAAQ